MLCYTIMYAPCPFVFQHTVCKLLLPSCTGPLLACTASPAVSWTLSPPEGDYSQQQSLPFPDISEQSAVQFVSATGFLYFNIQTPPYFLILYVLNYYKWELVVYTHWDKIFTECTSHYLVGFQYLNLLVDLSCAELT